MPVRSAPARSNAVPKEQNKESKEPKQRQPRRKNPQQSGQKKTQERKNSEFEDVKFETPPLTPTSEPGGQIPISGITRDEEFWKFYDKGKG